MAPMKKITIHWLHEQFACLEHRKLFRELYPKGINVCWKCFKEAQSQGLDVAWLREYVSDAEVERKIYEFFREAKTRAFPHLSRRFGPMWYNPDWEIAQLPNAALRILEADYAKQ